MLDHEQLLTEWETDCKVPSDALLERMYRHPILHSKYLGYLQSYKISSRKVTLRYQKLRLLKTRYYNGELSEEELIENNLKQYLYKRPLKSEMESLLDADADLQKLQEQILYIETLIQSTEAIMKELTNQHYLFKNIIEQTKYLTGN
jgi:hypothetical protein